MEEQIAFNAHSDLMVYGVSSEDENDMIAEISGYGIKTKFNMDRINSLDDAEYACQAMANVFFKALYVSDKKVCTRIPFVSW